MRNTKIREIKETDYEDVSQMICDNFPRTRMTPEKLAQRIADGAVIYVATRGKWLLGFADMQIEPKTFVRGIVVDPKVRRKGLGSALLKCAIKHVRKAGKNRVYLKVLSSNYEAIRLYQKLGFAPKREIIGNSGEELIIMINESKT